MISPGGGKKSRLPLKFANVTWRWLTVARVDWVASSEWARDDLLRRRQPDDHHFWLAHDAGCHGWCLPAGRLGGHEGPLRLPPRVSNPLSERLAEACPCFERLS